MKKGDIETYAGYVILFVLSLGIYYWLNHLRDSQIKFLLDFYKNVVEIFFSNYHYFDEELGSYVGRNYLIGEKCLGLSITVLIFGVCGMVNVGKLRGYKKVLWILFSGVMAAVIGVFANILRLLSSIYFTVFARFELIHALLGIVIYLSALIFCYVFSRKIINNKTGGEDIEEHI